MLLSLNPPDEGIKRIIAVSKHKSAKWIKDLSTGDTWYWPAEESFHANVAKFVGITDFDKGIVIMEQ